MTELDASTADVVQTISMSNYFLISAIHLFRWHPRLGGGREGSTLDTVVELSASTGVVVQTIPVSDSPLSISSDGTNVWVGCVIPSNTHRGNVIELNASTGDVVQTLPVGLRPIGISSDGTDVWVANQDDNTVSEISIAAMPPSITSFSPASGPVGTVVTIKGTSLTGVTKVTFKGKTATITKDTATKIKVKVPRGATSGKIEVLTPDGKVNTAATVLHGDLDAAPASWAFRPPWAAKSIPAPWSRGAWRAGSAEPCGETPIRLQGQPAWPRSAWPVHVRHS